MRGLSKQQDLERCARSGRQGQCSTQMLTSGDELSSDGRSQIDCCCTWERGGAEVLLLSCLDGHQIRRNSLLGSVASTWSENIRAPFTPQSRLLQTPLPVLRLPGVVCNHAQHNAEVPLL